MKFTKKQFKRFSALVGAVSLSVVFGVGHLLAYNENLDTTPVITVPVLKTYNFDSQFSNTVVGEFCVYEDYPFNLEYGNSVYTDNFMRVAYYTVDDEFATDLYFYLSSSFIPLNPVGDTIVLSRLEQILGYTDTLTSLSWTIDIDITGQGGSAIFGYDIDYVINNTDNRTYSSFTSLEDKFQHLPDDTRFDISHTEDTGTLKLCFQLLEQLSTSYNNAYQEGVNYVLNNSTFYGLYTQTQYLAYGNSEYYRGLGNASNVLSIGEFAREIFRSPISMFQNAFNFVLPLPDGTSLNVGGILTFFLTIGIALTIVNLIMKIGGH